MAASESDDVVDGEEIASEAEPLDQLELMVELGEHLIRDVLAPPLLRSGPGQMLEMRLRAAPLRHRLARIFVSQLIEAEVQRIGELAGCRNRMRPASEQPSHFLGRFQMPLGIGVQKEARLGDGRLLADARHHVLKRALLGRMIMDVIGSEDRAAVCAGDPVEPLDPRIVVASVVPACRDVAERWNGVTKPWKLGFENVEIVLRPGNEGNAFRMPGNVREA